MTDSKTDRLLSFSKLARAASGKAPAETKSSRFARPIDTDRLEGSLAGSARRGESGGQGSRTLTPLSRRLAERAPDEATRSRTCASAQRSRSTISIMAAEAPAP